MYANSCRTVRILLLQRSCKPFIVSSVTPPTIKKYIRGQDPVVLCACTFFKLNCRVAFGRQSPGVVVVKALLFALHDKDNSFFVKIRTNTVGRTIRFLVAKALNFKIRENSRLRRVFRVCVICVFLRTVVSSPIGQQNALTSDAQKTQKTRLRRGCERRHADADAKDATQTRPPSPAYFALPNSVSNLSLPCSHS